MSKTNQGNFFEDFMLGQIIEHPTARTITDADASLYIALTGSRFSLFCNEHYAKQLGFTRQPLDNFLVFNIAFGKTVQDVSLNAVANLGYAELQFYLPTYCGDTLSVVSEVIGLKENSNGKTGIVYVHSKAFNQHGHLVLSWKRWVMVHKRIQGMHNTFAVEPQLQSSVTLSDISVPDSFNSTHYDTSISGEKFLFADYEKGEWIDHVDGLTIDHSEHTMATKLYQNSAKVHFNHHQMVNSPHHQRLVYGGHIISLCRTISHNGLANALWLAAINAGAHTNPTYAGDTIYAATQVVDTFDKGLGFGVLRLRTVGFKNIEWRDIKDSVTFDENGKKSYHPQVVLDLDYSVIIAK
ncbi:MAG: hypothetical protein HWD86_03625 [Kangiellaceae bacterium]|nr:hypothetical protein [Kangiellaceae bacterium]